jgi:hypothetical protein
MAVTPSSTRLHTPSRRFCLAELAASLSPALAYHILQRPGAPPLFPPKKVDLRSHRQWRLNPQAPEYRVR